MPALDELDGALEARGVGALAAEPVAVAHVHLVVLAVQQGLASPLRQRPPRGVHRELEVVGQRGHDPLEVVGGPRAAGPRRDRTLRQGEVLVGDDEVGVDLELGADAGALGAGAERAVERERAGLDLVHLQRVVVGAGHLLGEPALPLGVARLEVDELDDEQPAGQAERGLDRVGEAPLGRRVVGPLGDEPVDDHVDGVLDLLLELGRVGERDHLAVDPGAGEALGLQLGEEVDVLALAGPDDRGEHLEAGALGQLEEPVDDLLRALPGDRLAAHRAVWATRAGEEEAQVVVDLGDRADRGARVAVGRLLVDRHRRREPLDEVDVGLVHLAQELPGVGRQRLDVAPLPLREDGVEGQAGLPGTGQAGEHDEAVAGQFDADVLEVVLAGTTDDEVVMTHARHARWGHRQDPHPWTQR